ncbi:MAG: hypothetical protein R2824_32740 [Saprospiraceae bacterium]|nr:hypothetical protein [Lewinella sp.]
MKKKIFKYLGIILLAVSLQTIIPEAATAQCPMCRMSVESNLQNGGQSAKGLNNGILYMLATPYLLVGFIGYVWWRNRRKEDEILEEAE